MKSVRLKQFGLALFVIFSLFASPVSACACSHHQEKTEIDLLSCHEHSPQTKVEHHRRTDAPDALESTISEIECCCASPAPRAASKSETIKFEKQIATIFPAAPVKTVSVSQVIEAKINFTKPFYLTDSFYNFAPGRAPPRS